MSTSCRSRVFKPSTANRSLTVAHPFGPAEQRRRDTIAAAVRGLAAERGCAATTVRDIAARSGTTPDIVYRCFVSKDQIPHHVSMDWAAQTRADIQDTDYPRAGLCPGRKESLSLCAETSSTQE
ncbi:TetR/AcrR family transcriptional regulator [Uniformispora flossi]|uniref:TetR/AcrR family transcriptional regulator n=1 Tax=Uniformispora flossi TaxID=3390723 RepID=UPI003C2F2F64